MERLFWIAQCALDVVMFPCKREAEGGSTHTRVRMCRPSLCTHTHTHTHTETHTKEAMWPRGRDCSDATISQRVPKPLEAGGTKHPFTPKPEEGARFRPSNTNFGLWNLKSVSEYISFILGFPFHGKLLQQHQERIQVPVGLGLLLFEPALHHAPWLFFFKKNLIDYSSRIIIELLLENTVFKECKRVKHLLSPSAGVSQLVFWGNLIPRFKGSQILTLSPQASPQPVNLTHTATILLPFPGPRSYLGALRPHLPPITWISFNPSVPFATEMPCPVAII